MPADEASAIKSRFFDLQVGLYGALSPMEPGLPAIDADPQKALDEAYTAAHRKCFPAPVLPPEYQGPVDLGTLAIAGRRVMRDAKENLEQLAIRHHCRIVRHADGLGVTSGARAYEFVGGIGDRAAAIT